MGVNVSGNVQLTTSFTETITSGVVQTQNLPAGISQALNYTSGTGAGQINLIYAKQLTLNATPTTLDLTNLADLTGSSYSFARVREIIIANLASTGGQTLTIGSSGGVGSGFSGFWGTSATITVHPATASAVGSANIVRFADPFNTSSTSGAVVGASNKNILLNPGANSFSVNVIILGCDAFS